MWDERYNQAEYAYGKNPNDFLAENIKHLPKGKVLCLADGEGRNSVYLAEQGYEVTAVDASASGMQKARLLADERAVNMNVIVSDLADFEIEENSWDGVVSIFCHLPPDLRNTVHGRVVKALKPGGVLLLEAYTPDQIALGTGGPPIAEMTMTLDALREECKGLELVHGIETRREIIEGKYHTGVGAVVQLIAVKKGS